MLFTTNKSPLTAWGAVLHGADLAEAIVDRILERGRLMLLDGPSYRTQHLDRDVDGSVTSVDCRSGDGWKGLFGLLGLDHLDSAGPQFVGSAAVDRCGGQDDTCWFPRSFVTGFPKCFAGRSWGISRVVSSW